MINITEKELLKKVDDYLSTEDGKKYIFDSKKKAFMSTKRSKDYDNALITGKDFSVIAKDIVLDIYYAIRKVIPSFEEFTNSVSLSKINTKKVNTFAINATFSEKSLRRESFYRDKNDKDGSRTGDGVYDIVGLFTKGYRKRRNGKRLKYVYGYWENHTNKNGSSWFRSHSIAPNKAGLKKNAFVKNKVNELRKKWEKYGITINFTEDWGGNIPSN